MMNYMSGTVAGTQTKLCDLRCPVDGVQYCCSNCQQSRKYFVNDANRHLWTEGHGFWSTEGCKLEERPKECLEYDCKGYQFLIVRTWVNGWQDHIIKTRINYWQSPFDKDGWAKNG